MGPTIFWFSAGTTCCDRALAWVAATIVFGAVFVLNAAAKLGRAIARASGRRARTEDMVLDRTSVSRRLRTQLHRNPSDLGRTNLLL
jgi:hypothetical protein